MASARATAVLGPSTTNDGSTTEWPGGSPLCPIPVPTVAITVALMGYSPAPQAAGLEGMAEFWEEITGKWQWRVTAQYSTRALGIDSAQDDGN